MNLFAKTSASDEFLYRNTCQRAADEDSLFTNFKRDPGYIGVLEHLGKCTGIPYLKIIKDQTPELLQQIEVFRQNDTLGNPRRDFYEDIGLISTTTIRYIKVASDLITLFDSLDGKSIVEIGGGYGGQCFILSQLFKFEKYTIIDLPEALALTKKYLDKHGVTNVEFIPFDQSVKDQAFDLVISNYAFNECKPEMQRKYMREILANSSAGYITGGGGGFPHSTMDFLSSKHISYELLEEKPLTSPQNVILIWGN